MQNRGETFAVVIIYMTLATLFLIYFLTVTTGSTVVYIILIFSNALKNAIHVKGDNYKKCFLMKNYCKKFYDTSGQSNLILYRKGTENQQIMLILLE